MNKQFLLLTVLPILGLGVSVTLIVSYSFSKSISTEVHHNLENTGNALLLHFDFLYPGDYSLHSGISETGQTTYQLYKGDADITQSYEYIDCLKEKTGIDFSIFYKDTRVLTTIMDSHNQRMIGGSTHPVILDDVLTNGNSHFYNKVLLDSQPYFAYYTPIKNSNGEIIGMLFAGKPALEVNALISHVLSPIFWTALFTSIAFGAISISNSRKLVHWIQIINRFLSKVALGNLNTELDSRIITRKDELGDLGRNAINMQKSLRILIEQDVLTGLHNRRHGERILQHLIAENHNSKNNFSVAIGDIDFFKNVNDTYGHEAGDVVLKGVSQIMKKHMNNMGYAVRWGGEEFLFIFEDVPYKQALKILQDFLEEIRSTTFTYNMTSIKITMTLGIVKSQPQDPLNIILKCADDKLYKGKTNGRNQIVT